MNFISLSRHLTLSATLLVAMTAASALDFKVGDLVIDHPYATPSLVGRNIGGGFIKSIKNTGNTPDQLIAARTAAAASVELHQMSMDGGIMRMREVSAIEIPAKGEVELRQGGVATYHLMLIGLKAPLKGGDRFPLTLVFKKAGEKEVMVSVQTPKAAAANPQHQGH